MGEDGLRVARLGLVGVGAWARRYIDTIARRRDCRIVAYARASAKVDDTLPGIRRCAGWTELLDLKRQGELDGLIVATTPDSQAEITEAAISDGVPILVEKPLGLSVDTVRRILHHHDVSTARPPVVVDFIHLWAPAYRALKDRVQDLGHKIVSVESEGCGEGPFREWSSLYDYGSHDVALCLDLLRGDRPFALREARRIGSGSAMPPGELFEARFGLGAANVSIRVGNGAARKIRRFMVTLSGGRQLVYDDLRPHPFKALDGEHPLPTAEGSPLDAVISHFLGLIDAWATASRPDLATAVSLALSVRVSEILDKISEATRTS